MGVLHALSVGDACLRWHPDGAGVTLWPNVAFLPKVLSPSSTNQPIQLSRFNPLPVEGGSGLLCPVRALEAYINATAGIRRSMQLFICYGGPRKGDARSKQRLSHWVVDAIVYSYAASAHPPPLGVRCHSAKGVSTSWASLRGLPTDAIRAAASWASPSTFTRFYRVNVACSQPLGAALSLGSSASNV